MRNSITEAVMLLREIEEQEGCLRLDLNEFPVAHDDDEWKSRVFGDWLDEHEEKVNAVHLSMFESPLAHALLQAAKHLDSQASSILTNTPIGWTSIPILNACAVRRNETTAIALNFRLSSVLTAAAAINWDLQKSVNENDATAVQSSLYRLKTVLQRSSEERYDLVLSESQPYPTRFHSWFGNLYSLLQMLFVLLHEIGHLALGHLDNEDFWRGHPLTRSTRRFFTGSMEAEYEADAYAISRLLDLSKWKTAGAEVEFLSFSLDRPYSVPIAIIELFAWFHIIAPMNEHAYYQIPRSHPHPFDRAQRIVEAVEAADPLLGDSRVRQSFENYRKFLHAGP